MSRRLTLTLTDEEWAEVLRLHAELDPDTVFATFAATWFVSAVYDGLDDLNNARQNLAEFLNEWSPTGPPN